jgi:DNA-binding NtrC family response regulator
MKLKVLLIDDDKNIRQTLTVSLSTLDCQVKACADLSSALHALKEDAFDFVLTDFKLDQGSGLDVLKAIRSLPHPPIAVVMTAFASFDNAVNAIKEGAYDYLPKPFSTAQLEHVLNKVRSLIGLRAENESLKRLTHREDYFKGMTSPAMERLEAFVNTMAPTDTTVLMLGESGTGKTDLAKVIHSRSKRAKHPFVVINCTSLAETLLESELFGHVKGAFTGAVSDHPGKFEAAQQGTVFLDEIGDLSLNGQAKLLRVLQEKVIERVGSNKPIQVDVRVIAATHKNLEEAVKAGTFREDLYYRLNVFECEVVSLRHRKEDLPVLIKKFLHEFSVTSGLMEDQKISAEIRHILEQYSWPGNIRELRNVIERMVFLSRNREVTLDDLPPHLLRKPEVQSEKEEPFLSLEELEKQQIERVLKKFPNQEEAAQVLGTTTVTLWRKRKQYGLP